MDDFLPPLDAGQQLDGLLREFPGFLELANEKEVSDIQLIRLDDLYLRLKLWKHDINASGNNFPRGQAQSGHLLTFTTRMLVDLSQQIRELSDILNGQIEGESENDTILDDIADLPAFEMLSDEVTTSVKLPLFH